MSHTIYAAYAGMRSRERALEVLSNNLANLGAAGFKKTKVQFSTRDELKGADVTELAGAINRPIVEIASATDFSAGQLTETGNPLDLALKGDGFFVVETPEGIRYTRNGSFSLSEEGILRTSEGHTVLSAAPAGRNRPLVLPQGQIEAAPNGQVSVEGVQVGTLKIVSFENLADLSPRGSTLFEAKEDAVEIPPARAEVLQGFLERANINPIEAVTEMISLLRSFEMMSHAVRSISSDVDSKVINEVGKV